MTQDQATVAEEEYLQSMFWLEEAGLPMTGARACPRPEGVRAPRCPRRRGRAGRRGSNWIVTSAAAVIGISLNFVLIPAFMVAAYVERRIVAGGRPSVWWQLLAYAIASKRGLNVDQPRNLAKTVTVE